jgi:ribonuclease P protein component
MSTCSLNKSDRLLKREDYLSVGKEGKRIKTKHFIVLFRENNLKINRFGVTASKKIGGAVKRNRIKRLIREFFRINRDKFSSSTDFVFIAGRASYLLDYQAVSKELLTAFKRNGLLN